MKSSTKYMYLRGECEAIREGSLEVDKRKGGNVVLASKRLVRATRSRKGGTKFSKEGRPITGEPIHCKKRRRTVFQGQA